MNRLSFLKRALAAIGFTAFWKHSKAPVVDNSDIIAVSICAFSTTGGTHLLIRDGSPTDKRIKESLELCKPVWES